MMMVVDDKSSLWLPVYGMYVWMMMALSDEKEKFSKVTTKKKKNCLKIQIWTNCCCCCCVHPSCTWTSIFFDIGSDDKRQTKPKYWVNKRKIFQCCFGVRSSFVSDCANNRPTDQSTISRVGISTAKRFYDDDDDNVSWKESNGMRKKMIIRYWKTIGQLPLKKTNLSIEKKINRWW